jgi:membrane-bound ClpP family serine protease
MRARLYQVLDKFSQQHDASYSLVRCEEGFTLRIKTDDFGELIRRINLIKGSKYQIVEMVGNPNVKQAKANFTPTNVDALVGRETVAQTDIKPVEGGLIKIFGEQWFARPEADDVIAKGTTVKVLRVEGVSLIVEEVEEEET